MRKKRQQFKNPKKLDLSWIKKFIKPLVLILLVGLPFYLVPRMIQIKHIECESQYGPCSQNLQKYLLKAENNNYVTSKNYIDNLFNKQIFATKYSVKFKLPSTLEVYAVERKPVLALTSESDKTKFVLLDTDGFILAIEEDNQLPVIVIRDEMKFTVGEKVDSNLLSSLEIMEQAFALFDSRLAVYNKTSLEVDLPIGTKAIFPLHQDTQVLFGALSLILSRLNTSPADSRIEVAGKRIPVLVDLRYKNPVIKFE